MKIEFKTIDDSDINIVVNMMQNFYAIDNYPFDVEASKKLYKTFIQNEHLGRGWLILYDNIPIGYIILTFCFSFEYRGRIAFLDELYFSEDFRGKGLGKKALAFLQQEFLKQSLNIICLEVERHNMAARKLYLANNFEIHKRDLMRYTVK